MADEKIIRFKVKSSQLDFEYEGNEEFVGTSLLDFIKDLTDIHKTLPPITETPPPQKGPQGDLPPAGGSNINQSLVTIAKNLNVKTGTDLTLAACVYLTFSARKEIFTRDEILATMKTATTYYNRNIRSNLGQSLNTLLSQKKIHQQADLVYALTTQTRDEMELKLAN
jgi:hypothetical protein